MKNEIRFALFAIKKNIQNSAELRTSFLMNIFGMSINNLAFILLWTTFVDSVGTINGWTKMDVVALQGFVALNYGIVTCFGAGLMRVADTVANGSFDRFMLSPKNLIVRMATSNLGVSAAGDMFYGIICLIFYAIWTNLSINGVLIMIILTIFSSTIFLAFLILISAMSFLFTDAAVVTDGFFELVWAPSLFHGGAFTGGLRFVFTFVLPSLLFGAIPAEITKELAWGKLLFMGIGAVVWMLVSVKLFERGVRRYESSNLMTFGN